MTAPPSIVYETQDEADERHRKAAERDLLLTDVEQERAPFTSATSMLSWFFALQGHMESVSAIDPSSDVIQGLRVDRDERAWKIQSVRQALAELQRQQGSAQGALLLWLHLRPRVVIGKKRRRGVEVLIWDDPVPLWELYRYPTVRQLSQRACTRLYWESLEQCEDFALNRRWIAERAERKSKAAQVYRRGG